MTSVAIYELKRTPLLEGLPRLISKIYEAGFRVLIKTPNKDRAPSLNDTLWTFPPQAFLPHGMEGEASSEDHPIWITTQETNDNNANLLVTTDGVEHSNMASFAKCVAMFEGQDESVRMNIHSKIAEYQKAGFEVTYWQESETGVWNKQTLEKSSS